MTMTMTEQVLAKSAKRDRVSPGDNVWLDVDVLMTHDVCGPGTIGIFKKQFGADAKVWDAEKLVIIPDHYIFTDDPRANRNVDILREFATKYDIKYFYDIQDRSDFKVNPNYKGVCHVALAQEGHALPGEVLFGTDSHTCNAGAFGMFSTGIGNTDAGFILGTGKLLIKVGSVGRQGGRAGRVEGAECMTQCKVGARAPALQHAHSCRLRSRTTHAVTHHFSHPQVPPTIRFNLVGEMPPYLLAKDLILQIIGEISVSGATYKAMEFAGEALAPMTMDERMTICNMAVEAGGKNGIIAPDETTFDYVRQRSSHAFEPVYGDDNASYLSLIHI